MGEKGSLGWLLGGDIWLGRGMVWGVLVGLYGDQVVGYFGWEERAKLEPGFYC